MHPSVIQAAGGIKNPKARVMPYTFAAGLVTARDEAAMTREECSECLNLVLNPDARWQTRPGMTQLFELTNAYTVTDIKDFDVGVLQTTIVAATGEIYSWNGTTATNIGAVAGTGVRLTRFGKYMIATGYGQYAYPMIWDGTTFQTIYDAGIGELAEDFTYDNRGGKLVDYPTFNPNTLGNTTVRLAIEFIAGEGWDTYKMPAGKVYFQAAKQGNGYAAADGPLYLRIRQKSDDDIVYERAVLNVSQLPQVTGGGSDTTDYLSIEVEFTADDLQGAYEGLDASPIEYYLSLEYAGGDASNYVWIAACDNTGGGAYYTASWQTWDRSPYLAFRTQVPPVLEQTITHNGRLWGFTTYPVSEPTRLWYSAAGDPFDWSTENGGGYIDIGKPIGGIASYYGDLWVFGTQAAPFLFRVSGDDPASFVKTDAMQQISAHHRSIVATPEDVYFLSPAGVGSLKTMQEFGDVRVLTQTDAIQDRIDGNWTTLYSLPHFSTAAFIGYDPEYGTVLLHLDDATDDTFVLHPKYINVRLFGRQGYRSAPISLWQHELPQRSAADQLISCFSSGRYGTYIGTTQGRVYYLDTSVFTDGGAGNDPSYDLVSGSPSTRMDEHAAWRLSFDMESSDADGAANIVCYADGGATAKVNETKAVSDRDRFGINFNYRRLKCGYETITPDTAPMSFGPILIEYKNVGNW